MDKQYFSSIKPGYYPDNLSNADTQSIEKLFDLCTQGNGYFSLQAAMGVEITRLGRRFKAICYQQASFGAKDGGDIGSPQYKATTEYCNSVKKVHSSSTVEGADYGATGWWYYCQSPF